VHQNLADGRRVRRPVGEQIDEVAVVEWLIIDQRRLRAERVAMGSPEKPAGVSRCQRTRDRCGIGKVWPPPRDSETAIDPPVEFARSFEAISAVAVGQRRALFAPTGVTHGMSRSIASLAVAQTGFQTISRVGRLAMRFSCIAGAPN